MQTRFFVGRVTSRVVGHPYGKVTQKFDIHARVQTPLHAGRNTYSTFSAEAARLAGLALQQGTPVEVTYRDTRWGRDLVDLRLAPAPEVQP